MCDKWRQSSGTLVNCRRNKPKAFVEPWQTFYSFTSETVGADSTGRLLASSSDLPPHASCPLS
jgi:hypothetical protein